MLQQYANGEKQMKGELAQLKLKQEQSDNKLAISFICSVLSVLFG